MLSKRSKCPCVGLALRHVPVALIGVCGHPLSLPLSHETATPWAQELLVFARVPPPLPLSSPESSLLLSLEAVVDKICVVFVAIHIFAIATDI